MKKKKLTLEEAEKLYSVTITPKVKKKVKFDTDKIECTNEPCVFEINCVRCGKKLKKGQDLFCSKKCEDKEFEEFGDYGDAIPQFMQPQSESLMKAKELLVADNFLRDMKQNFEYINNMETAKWKELRPNLIVIDCEEFLGCIKVFEKLRKIFVLNKEGNLIGEFNWKEDSLDLI